MEEAKDELEDAGDSASFAFAPLLHLGNHKTSNGTHSPDKLLEPTSALSEKLKCHGCGRKLELLTLLKLTKEALGDRKYGCPRCRRVFCLDTGELLSIVPSKNV